MSFDPVLRALAEHWRSASGYLTAQTARRVLDLLSQITAAAPADDALDAMGDLLEVLSAALPASHPIRRAIVESSGTRSTAVLDIVDDALMAQLRSIVEPELVRLFGSADTPDESPPGQLAREAMTRLLGAAALTADELRDRGGDPALPHLIQLSDDDRAQYPAFQFDAAGRPIRLVLDINELLDAQDDPWGAADWWLGRNAWLDGTPAESIGHVPDGVLLAAAHVIAGRD